MLRICMGAEDLNSGPYAWTANIFPLSPHQPHQSHPICEDILQHPSHLGTNHRHGNLKVVIKAKIMCFSVSSQLHSHKEHNFIEKKQLTERARMIQITNSLLPIGSMYKENSLVGTFSSFCVCIYEYVWCVSDSSIRNFYGIWWVVYISDGKINYFFQVKKLIPISIIYTHNSHQLRLWQI